MMYEDGKKNKHPIMVVFAIKKIGEERRTKIFTTLGKAEKWMGKDKGSIQGTINGRFTYHTKYRFLYINGQRRNYRSKLGRFNHDDYYYWNTWLLDNDALLSYNKEGIEDDNKKYTYLYFRAYI